MANTNQSGRQRIFRERGMAIPQDTLITPDNFQIFLTQEALISIANKVSAITKQKLRHGQIDALTKFIARLPGTRYYQKDYNTAQNMIASDFVVRHERMLRTVQEQDLDEHLSGVDQDTDAGTIADYEKKEIFQFTPDENAYKFSAHQDRRGNSVIDEERVAGKRSSPDNLLPLNAVKTQYIVNKELYKTLKLLQSFMAPESTEEMFNKIQTISTDYDNITLVHQLIQFDSRNRLPVTYNTNEYKWNVHTSGQTGQLGNVRILDTLQQIVRMQAYPFWAPVNNSVLNPYAKIRMLIKEFVSQSVIVSEFNDPDQSTPTIEYYHWEFEVQEVSGDRMYLVPKQPLFTFRKPMARIDTITTQFRTPFSDEVFDPDSGVFTITYANPTLFTITNPAVHLLNTGDLIYVYNSDSGDTTIDAEINNVNGHIITKLSTTEFTIPVDSSTLVGTETSINVYYGSKRLFFQIEFLSLEQ
jgi:hypothetical protein